MRLRKIFRLTYRPNVADGAAMHYDPIPDFEAACAGAGVQIAQALKNAGVAQSTYWRWKNGKFEPKSATIRRLYEAIAATPKSQ